jgi:hypothetical protein
LKHLWSGFITKNKKDSGSSLRPARSSKLRFGGGGGGGGDFANKIKERWQIFAIGIIAILIILTISFLGPITGGQTEIVTTGSPIDKVPVIAFFALLIMAPLFMEAGSRNDIFDAVFVLLSILLSSTAVAYETKWSTLMNGTRPLGTHIIGFFFWAPYLIMTMSAVTNRTRNVFAGRTFRTTIAGNC